MRQENAGLAAVSSSEGLRLFEAADRDGDGQLTLDEFGELAKQFKALLEPATAATARPAPVPAASEQLSQRTRVALRKAFANFDLDNSGCVNAEHAPSARRARAKHAPHGS